MKKLLLSFAFMATSAVVSIAQEAIYSPISSEIDYSSFSYTGYYQTWTLSDIILNKDYTAIQIRITINNNLGGWFSFPESIYISGDWGRLSPIGLYVGDDQWQLGKHYSYNKKNKGKGATCTLFFPRIPAGVSSLNYVEPNYITWRNITIKDNPDTEHTDYTQVILKEVWAERGVNAIEGIYHFVSTDDKKWWGESKHTLAVIKTNDEYEMIYLKGANEAIWREGDLKARFIPTAAGGLYKATTWLMDNKMENDNFYLKFDNQGLYIYETDKNISAEFIKLFPSNETIVADNRSRDMPSAADNPGRVQKTGSGIIISTNGVVMTNYHVIEDAKTIDIVIKDNRSVSTYKAKVLASDKTNDLALLMIDDEKFLHFDSIPFAISTRTSEVGTSVFAMGYPMSLYMGDEVKITDGIISSRTGYQGDIVTYQISAPIQPGNSGGPLFDKKGYLVGITNAGIMDANNVGYAIKSSYVRNLIESAPISIDIPEVNKLQDLELTEQIKQLSKFVTHIKVK